ncbi:hypothetical protein J3A83DRAFT_4369336 [Scleroderma citrinum]
MQDAQCANEEPTWDEIAHPHWWTTHQMEWILKTLESDPHAPVLYPPPPGPPPPLSLGNPPLPPPPILPSLTLHQYCPIWPIASVPYEVIDIQDNPILEANPLPIPSTGTSSNATPSPNISIPASPSLLLQWPLAIPIWRLADLTSISNSSPSSTTSNPIANTSLSSAGSSPSRESTLFDTDLS